MVATRVITALPAANSNPSNTILGISNGSGALYPAPRLTRLPARRPTNIDDATRGYAVGDHWNSSEQVNGRLWYNLGNTTNASQWALAVTPPVPIVDAVTAISAGAAPVCAYGVSKIVSGYSGACLQITRASDSTTHDVSFLANGVLNWADGDAFVNGTTGYVSKLYDQSGNANHATQATSSVAVQWQVTYVNGQRALSFDGTTAVAVGANLLQRYFVLPAGVSVTMTTSTVMWIGKNKSGYSNQGFWQLGTNSSGVYQGLVNTLTAGTRNGYQIFRQSNNSLSASAPSVNLDVLMLVNTPSSMTLLRNDEAALTFGVVPTVSTVTGGYLGAVDWTQTTPNQSYNSIYDFMGFAVWGRSLSSNEQLAAKESSYMQFGIVTQRNLNWIVMGDSITWGFLVPGNRNIIYQAEIGLSFKPRIWNFATSGYTLSDMVTMYPYSIAPLYDPTKTNVITIAIGTNDLGAGSATAASLIAVYGPLIATMQAAGFVVGVATVLNASSYTGSTAKNAERLIFNLWMTSGASGANFFIDLASDPTMNNNANVASTTYYFDQLHPTPFGESYLMPYYTAKLEAIPLKIVS